LIGNRLNCVKFFGVDLEHKGDDWKTNSSDPFDKLDWTTNEKSEDWNVRDPSNFKVQHSKIELLGSLNGVEVVISIRGELSVDLEDFSGLVVDVSGAVSVVSGHGDVTDGSVGVGGRPVNSEWFVKDNHTNR